MNKNNYLWELIDEEKIEQVNSIPLPEGEELSYITLGKWQLGCLLVEQQILTMAKISTWLRGNAKMRNAGGEIIFSKQLLQLADELDYFSKV